MYLIKNSGNAVHGVDYTKGLEDGEHCGKIHPYQTKRCRPVLFPKDTTPFSENTVDYNSLTDREKLELGEPVFFQSPLFHALSGGRRNYVTYHHSLTYNGKGEVVNEETIVENS